MNVILCRNKTLNQHTIFKIYPALTFFILIIFIKLCTAKLTVYDSFNNKISEYENVDFMGIDQAMYDPVTGKLLVATFEKPNDEKEDACKIKNLPIDGEVAIVVIPFQQAYDAGCISFADVLISNNWIN